MKKMKTVALVATISLAPLAASAATNLISNGGFENGTTGWSCTAANCNSTSVSNTGSGAIYGYENTGFASLSQTIATTVGTLYDVSFWSRAYFADPGNEVGYRFDGGTSVTQAATLNYSQISTSFVATGSSSLIELLFATDPGTGIIYFDDVSVTANETISSLPETSPVPLPASLSMLLVAAGGLGVASRRRRKAS